MKYVAFFAVLFLSVNLSLQLLKPVDCTSDYVLPKWIAKSCGALICFGPLVRAKGCGTYQCQPDKYLGYIEPDNSKPYPECCGRPICAD